MMCVSTHAMAYVEVRGKRLYLWDHLTSPTYLINYNRIHLFSVDFTVWQQNQNSAHPLMKNKLHYFLLRSSDFPRGTVSPFCSLKVSF